MDFRNEGQNKVKISNVTALAKQHLYRDAHGHLLLTKENIAKETNSNFLRESDKRAVEDDFERGNEPLNNKCQKNVRLLQTI